MIQRARPTLVTVVVPVRNGAATIDGQLEALAAQTYPGPFEVVVCDNGSTDGTGERVRAWTERLPALRVVVAADAASLSYARNAGARAARGELIAFTDADDRVEPGWLDALVAVAPNFDIVAGRLDASVINEPAVQAWRPRMASGPTFSGNFLAFAPGSNFCMWADTFRALGGCNEQYRRQQDVELSWRAQLSGFTLGFTPYAVVHYRHRDTIGGLARQAYGTGVGATQLFRDFRARGMPRSRVRVATRSCAWLLLHIPDAFRPGTRGRWVRLAASVTGRAVGSIRYRVLYL